MPILSPVSWQAVEDAIQAWFAGAAGLTTIWAQQDAPQPPYPFATLNVIAGPVRVGGQDETRYTTDLSKPAGEEIGVEIAGLRTMTVSCQVHVHPPASTDPAQHARNLMARAQSSLALLSVLGDLRLVGLSVVSEGPIQNLSAVVEDTWIGRAAMDVVFGLAASVEERTGYMGTLELSSALGVDADLELNDYAMGG